MSRPRGHWALTADQRALLLGILAQGHRIGEAAAIVGVHRNTVLATRTYDPAFGTAVTEAVEQGRAARRNRKAHGTEYRYIHLGCRCAPCTSAATAARLGRLDAAAQQQTTTSTDTTKDTPCPDSSTTPPPLLTAPTSTPAARRSMRLGSLSAA